MENRPLISIIVPVYKVEPYLDRCVESIVNQTYTNLEIILVDDGSPDNCPQMCDEWAKKDSRIKVIHKENGGLSDARNAGMTAATGSLIGFVDSDDWIREDMYRLLYVNMQETDSDISACGVKMIWEDGSPERMLTQEGCCILEPENAMRAVIEETWIKQPVWYKLYKADLIRNIPFPVGKFHEDVFWTYQAVGKAKRVSVIDEPCYYYWQRSGSIMGDRYSPKRLDALEAKQQMLKYIQDRFPALEPKTQVNLWFSCIYHGQQILSNFSSVEKNIAFKHLLKVRNDLSVSISDMKELPFTHRCWLWMSKYSFILTCRLRNLLKIGY